MVFGETVAVYCENHTEHTDTVCGQTVEFLDAKLGGTYSYRSALSCKNRMYPSKRIPK
jgi:hypothetical protein